MLGTQASFTRSWMLVVARSDGTRMVRSATSPCGMYALRQHSPLVRAYPSNRSVTVRAMVFLWGENIIETASIGPILPGPTERGLGMSRGVLRKVWALIRESHRTAMHHTRELSNALCLCWRRSPRLYVLHWWRRILPTATATPMYMLGASSPWRLGKHCTSTLLESTPTMLQSGQGCSLSTLRPLSAHAFWSGSQRRGR
mmetsp:Transcript_34846/g.75749  ORF Transcript_34846/g.75749 Transcript_34846/m.75749 type:complete len:200 (+) Transcript_34846:548-1147(+)